MVKLARIFQIPVIFLWAAPMVTACATSTSHNLAESPRGYSEQQIGENRFRVTFTGNSSFSKGMVEDHLLFRAANLTIERGNDYFIVVKQETEDTRINRRITPLIYGYYPCGGHRFPYYAYGFSWAHYPAAGEIRRFEAVAFIVMEEGHWPEDNPSAFDARKVIDDLGAYFGPPRVELVDSSS